MKVKIFKDRASLYDHLSQTNPYIHGIYQVCKVQLTFFMAYVILCDSYAAGKPWLNLSNDAAIFGSPYSWLMLLLLETAFLCSFMLLYPVFHVWKWLWSKLGMVATMVYLMILCSWSAGLFVALMKMSPHLNGIPRVVAVVEWARLLIKMVSFVSENRYKVQHPWTKDDESGPAQWYGGQMSPRVGTFSQYIYFLFAPTLIYRDHYPRNKGGIKWSNVIAYASQFLMVFLMAKVLFLEQYPDSFKQEDLVALLAKMILLSPLMNFLASLLVFHAWFNLTAELTRFADREFYLHWWSAVGYTEYYKLWNVPIHDFNIQYIFSSLKGRVPRPVGGLIVFVLSAFMHDIIIGYSMKFFLPVFLILFAVIGGIVFASGVKFSKYLTFLLTCCGYVLFLGVYFLELGARYHCPQRSPSPW